MENDLHFIYPPDMQKCQKHRRANRIFKGRVESITQTDSCDCCSRRVGEENDVKCCYSPVSSLLFLGPGIPLLFVFMQNAIIFLVSLILIYAIFGMVSNEISDSCQKNSQACIQNFFNEISFSNKIENIELVLIQSYVILGFVWVFGFIISFFVYRIRRITNICDEILDSPSDYAIVIAALPADVQEQDIQSMIDDKKTFLNNEEKQETDNLSVFSIEMSYNIEKYLQDQQFQREEYKKLVKQEMQQQFIRHEIQAPTQTSSMAIVVFNKQSSKDLFMDSLKLKNKLYNCFCNYCVEIGSFQVKDKHVLIDRAPEPDDILWGNTHKPSKVIFRNKVIALTVGVLILVAGGGVQFGLDKFQASLGEDEVNIAISTASSVLITVFNAIIVQFLVFVTSREGNRTKTELNRSLLTKICLFQFFNAGIFFTFAKILSQSLQNFNIQGNISYEITIFMAINAVSPSAISFALTYFQIIQKVLRFLVQKKLILKSQIEANELYEHPEVQITYHYAYTIRTMWLTAFYGPFVPIVVPISLVGIVLYYYMQAFLFRTSYSVPHMFSAAIAKTASRLTRVIPLMLTTGQFIILLYSEYEAEVDIKSTDYIPVYISLFISIIYIHIPWIKINKLLFSFEKTEKSNLKYQQIQHTFETTYKSTNPVTPEAEKIRRQDISFLKQMVLLRTENVRKTDQGGHDQTGIRNPFIDMFGAIELQERRRTTLKKFDLLNSSFI